MNKTNTNGYKEVKLENNGRGTDMSCHNPLSTVFRYEYALYTVVSQMFESVRNRSLCMGTLESYFLELPSGSEEQYTKNSRPGKKTRDKLLEEVKVLVDRDVIGKIRFPMINICAAEAAAIPEDDGTHTFVFTDGIYGFFLNLVMSGKGHPSGIRVKDLNPESRKSRDKLAGNIENAALSGAA